MKTTNVLKRKETQKLIKKCHCCGQVSESSKEIKKCLSCGKSFLPLNYFDKVHGDSEYKFDELFSPVEEIEEFDLIKGLYVIW